jgi:hypothetical protein
MRLVEVSTGRPDDSRRQRGVETLQEIADALVGRVVEVPGMTIREHKGRRFQSWPIGGIRRACALSRTLGEASVARTWSPHRIPRQLRPESPRSHRARVAGGEAGVAPSWGTDLLLARSRAWVWLTLLLLDHSTNAKTPARRLARFPFG